MKLLVCLFLLLPIFGSAQVKYWNEGTQLTPWRLPLTNDIHEIEYIDLDKDGDPDILKTTILDGIPILWIDDDDDMKKGDLEGDQNNDCLLIDRNKDGIYAGAGDLNIDWTDTDGDGIANVQLVISNANSQSISFFDWRADYMYIIDFGEKDGIHNFIDWNKLLLGAWQHSGFSNFFSDYHGNTLFLKMHASSFNIHNLEYNWENPFIFYDPDKDGLSEMAIRMVDTPHFRPKSGLPADSLFENVSPNKDVIFSRSINWVSVAWDLDNDNGQSNEFDFDMSLRFTGDGFDYSDQNHNFKNMKGLAAADSFLYDARWRNNETLLYTYPKVAYNKIFSAGKWNCCWMVFDEDDDCNRWERVEFYEPKDLWKIGRTKGGLDNNNQADAVGDRAEFDTDNSGGGKLYIAPFDGRLHLFGAEWGAWRIDQNATSYQGYGGLYPPASTFDRLAKNPDYWATVRYTDTNSNGFIDCIEYDLDGDAKFEEKVLLINLGIDDNAPLIETGDMKYKAMTKTFKKLTANNWNRAEKVQKIVLKLGINNTWYAFWKKPRTMNERYQYSFWLTFYLYKDMCHKALLDGNNELKTLLDKAYYSGNWNCF